MQGEVLPVSSWLSRANVFSVENFLNLKTSQLLNELLSTKDIWGFLIANMKGWGSGKWSFFGRFKKVWLDKCSYSLVVRRLRRRNEGGTRRARFGLKLQQSDAIRCSQCCCCPCELFHPWGEVCNEGLNGDVAISSLWCCWELMIGEGTRRREQPSCWKALVSACPSPSAPHARHQTSCCGFNWYYDSYHGTMSSSVCLGKKGAQKMELEGNLFN